MVSFSIVLRFSRRSVWFLGNRHIWVAVMTLRLGGFGVFDWWYPLLYMVPRGRFVVGFGHSLTKQNYNMQYIKT